MEGAVDLGELGLADPTLDPRPPQLAPGPGHHRVRLGERGGEVAASDAEQARGDAGHCPRAARPARAVAQTRSRGDPVATPVSAVGELANQTAAYQQIQMIVE